MTALTYVVSLGYLICMGICIPFGYLNLVNTTLYRYKISLKCLILYEDSYLYSCSILLNTHIYAYTQTYTHDSYSLGGKYVVPVDFLLGPVRLHICLLGAVRREHGPARHGLLQRPQCALYVLLLSYMLSRYWLIIFYYLLLLCLWLTLAPCHSLTRPAYYTANVTCPTDPLKRLVDCGPNGVARTPRTHLLIALSV